MKFTHRVKHNGIIYAPGQEVPVDEGTKERIEEEKIGKLELTKDELNKLEELYDYNQLKEIGKNAGLEFKGNIGKKALAELIRDHFTIQESQEGTQEDEESTNFIQDIIEEEVEDK